MPFFADLHIHSKYSRATSKQMDLENLYKWAQLKGIRVIGTGDFTHPEWFVELSDKLEPAEDGLYKLKDSIAREIDKEVPVSCKAEVRFLLSVEISSIYSKGEKCRKVHNIVFAPSLKEASKINSELQKIGNLKSDGRPILGLDSKKLLEICLGVSDRCYVVPAHIWTPHFAMFGSKTGFDSIEECFDELSDKIFAVETGLSSDPPMNWRLSKLDNVTLISNSDAHSPIKLARELNVFDCELSYDEMFNAIKEGNGKKFLGTIEFFPEEGKYHYDGHRVCEYSCNPQESIKNDLNCPECGKPLILGTMHRVSELADRVKGGEHKRAFPFKYSIPLYEIISEAYKVGVNSKKVMNEYHNLITKIGNEMYILLEAPLKDIEKETDLFIVEGIKRVREGNVYVKPGFDGEFGKISIFKDNDKYEKQPQIQLF
ncbi:endonuclease Q family protein [Patescibacteria group bacterium]